ncbi:MAG: hypothetical protein WBB37_07540 [bacterium]
MKNKNNLIFGFEIAELCSEEVKIMSLVDIDKLTEGDEDPFFVTVKALRVGVSKNKKRYALENLQQVKSQLPLYGFLGHLKKEDVGYRYREPITIWIGGEIIGEWLYVKGYIPPQYESHRKDVALSLKAKKPMPVSVLGWYRVKPQGEYLDVEDIQAISIDWANDRMEGIKGAQVVGIAKEQIETEEKEEVMPTKEEILAALTMDEVKKTRPDLVQSIQSEMKESEEDKKEREDAKKKMDTLESENKKLQKQIIDAHREKLLGEIKDEKLRTIAGDLLQGETTEELDKNWKLAKEKLSAIEKPGMPIISGAEEKKKDGSDFLQERLLSESKEA